MGKEAYVTKRFGSESLKLLSVIDGIIEDYMLQGYVLTVRQLYYQLVARALIPNTERSYKSITSLVNDGRLAGVLDWDGIEDRTRSFIRRSRWTSGGEIISACANSYHEDLWRSQPHRVFVIVEKEALAGVLEGVCKQMDVPLLAARGYPSGTVLREFAESDILRWPDQTPVILHLGDHDPSGIDMSRDLEERLQLFTYNSDIEFRRIALNMAQIEEQQPPENPAKSTDSRFEDYRRNFGDSSWELDALSPSYLNDLVRSHIEHYIDPAAWEEAAEAIAEVKRKLSVVASAF
jgi:hypothetical protein